MDAFARKLAEALNDPGLLDQTPDRERQQLEAAHAGDELGRLEPQGPVPAISARAIDMIVGFEVSSRAAYDRRYRHPIWPKGRSGVTFGIGYDAGYVDAPTLRADWTGNASDAHIALLQTTCGVTGQGAERLLGTVRDVDIAFDNAMAVFRDVTLVQTIAKTVRLLPNADKLHPDSLGALVSLVYNRGASFALAGDRYSEMRQIRQAMQESAFERIPDCIRSMKRLWANDPNARGLLVRRDLEALLFEEGLAQQAPP
jgi:GH24 family phage-related lysozyme (muramidase)